MCSLSHVVITCVFMHGKSALLGRAPAQQEERLLLSLRTRLVSSTHVRRSTSVTSVAEDLILSSSFCGHPHTHGIKMKIKFDTHNKAVHCFPKIRVSVTLHVAVTKYIESNVRREGFVFTHSEPAWQSAGA